MTLKDLACRPGSAALSVRVGSVRSNFALIMFPSFQGNYNKYVHVSTAVSHAVRAFVARVRKQRTVSPASACDAPGFVYTSRGEVQAASKAILYKLYHSLGGSKILPVAHGFVSSQGYLTNTQE